MQLSIFVGQLNLALEKTVPLLNSINRIFLLHFCLFGIFNTQGQVLRIDVIQQGDSYQDSSYYDILALDSEYWICGKYGTLKSIKANGEIKNVSSPSNGLDIYKMDKLDDNTIIASGDLGSIYMHNLASGQWTSLQVDGYKDACFYNLAVMSPTLVYVSGGNSKIAHSKKTAPEGFILESKDGGITWKEIYSNPFKMVWCVKKNPFDNQLYALMYTLNKTHLFKLEEGKWEKKEKIGNSIFHEIQFESKTDYVATGGWIGKKGRVHYNQRKVAISNAGLIWGRVANDKYELLPACNGQIVLGDKKGNHKLFGAQLNKDFRIYEAIFTSENTAIAIGSARTILMLKISNDG